LSLRSPSTRLSQQEPQTFTIQKLRMRLTSWFSGKSLKRNLQTSQSQLLNCSRSRCSFVIILGYYGLSEMILLYGNLTILNWVPGPEIQIRDWTELQANEHLFSKWKEETEPEESVKLHAWEHEHSSLPCRHEALFSIFKLFSSSSVRISVSFWEVDLAEVLEQTCEFCCYRRKETVDFPLRTQQSVDIGDIWVRIAIL
jgi:hypothetical protein